jgi:hypothetical protein
MVESKLELKFSNEWLVRYPDIDLHSEYQFCPPRRFRWDFCHLETRIGIEIQGGIWMQRSGHSGGDGLLKDYEKYCFAAANGWRLFTLASEMITGEYIDLIADTIKATEPIPFVTGLTDYQLSLALKLDRDRTPAGCRRRLQIGSIPTNADKKLLAKWEWQEDTMLWYLKPKPVKKAKSTAKSKSTAKP